MPINVHLLGTAKKRNEWQLLYASRQSNECTLRYKKSINDQHLPIHTYFNYYKSKDKDNIIFVIIYSFVVYRWISHREKKYII